MLINGRCTTCNDRIEADDALRCDDCGKEIHERCAEYETSFECPECAAEPEIGAVEF